MKTEKALNSIKRVAHYSLGFGLIILISGILFIFKNPQNYESLSKMISDTRYDYKENKKIQLLTDLSEISLNAQKLYGKVAGSIFVFFGISFIVVGYKCSQTYKILQKDAASEKLKD